MRRARTCGYAHELGELLPPREHSREYVGVSRDGVDRWYGHAMTEAQLCRIQEYYDTTPGWDRPVWAIALCWFTTRGDLGEYPNLGWDFGILQDALSLQRMRITEVCPAGWASRTDRGRVWSLRDILSLRREVLQGIRVERGLPSLRKRYRDIEHSSESEERMTSSETGMLEEPSADVGDL